MSLGIENTEFLNSLSVRDLGILRGIVKKIHMKKYPGELYTDEMADMLISKFGEEYGERLIKRAIDEGLA